MGTRIAGLWEGKLVSHDPSWLSVAVIKHGDQNPLCESRAGGRQEPGGCTWSRDHRGSLLTGGLSQLVRPEFLDIPGPDGPRWHDYSLCVSSWHKLTNMVTLIVPLKKKMSLVNNQQVWFFHPKGLNTYVHTKSEHGCWCWWLITHNCWKDDSIKMPFLWVNR